MHSLKGKIIRFAIVAALALTGSELWAVNIRDISNLQGARENQLMAVSLVVGLNGTGDGDSLETVRSLGRLFENFEHAGVSLDELNAANVSLVHITATIPSTGVRKGSKLDVQISSINGAKSLAGGRLIQCAMLGPMATTAPNGAFALASGRLVVDPDNPTTATIRGGAVMEFDYIPNVINNGRITLVLDKEHASWAIASSVATVVNDAEAMPGGFIAKAVSASEIIINIPRAEITNPANFISRILDLPVMMPDLKARIVINRSTGTIVITGDVEIDPVSFTQRGLSINIPNPKPEPTVDNPEITTERYQTFDPAASAAATTARKLTDAFNQLQVPVEDQIAVIWALKTSGRLHAEIIEE